MLVSVQGGPAAVLQLVSALLHRISLPISKQLLRFTSCWAECLTHLAGTAVITHWIVTAVPVSSGSNVTKTDTWTLGQPNQVCQRL